MKFQLKKQREARAGLTLIELMVVVAILVALTAIAIPAVRILNKDRKIREGGRQVNSMLASARDTALVTGFSGVEFVRNTNFQDANGVNFASTAMYRIKVPRVYAGDNMNDRVISCGPSGNAFPDGTGFLLELPAPLAMIANPSFIRVNDYVRLDYKGPLYRVGDLVPPAAATDPLVLEIVIPANAGMPPSYTDAAVVPNEAGMGYQIYRQPVRDERSRVELPKGIYVDLRLSGPLDLGGGGGLDTNPATPTTFGLSNGSALGRSRSTVILFDSTGAVDRVYTNGFTGIGDPGVPVFFRPSGPLHFLIVADPTGNRPVIDNLGNTDNLWIKVAHQTGATSTSSVVELGPADDGVANVDRIRKSRGIANTGQTAKQ